MTRASILALSTSLIAASAAAVPRGGAPLRESPQVALTVTPEGPTLWRFQLRNQGTTPVSVVADRRLVSLEFPPVLASPGRRAGRPSARRCVHGARPPVHEFSPRVTLAPGASYSERFDLRDHCALRVPEHGAGDRVTVRYGWDERTRRALVRSVIVDEGPSVVPSLETTVAAPGVPSVEAPAGDVELLRARASGSQAAQGDGLRVSVRVENPSAQPLWTFYRHGLWSFDVITPTGDTVRCDALTMSPGPRRDFFVRLGASGRRGATLTIADWCPSETFQQAGVYEARAVFESSADGEEWNLQRVFVGRVTSPPFALRVIRGRGAYRAWAPQRAP